MLAATVDSICFNVARGGKMVDDSLEHERQR